MGCKSELSSFFTERLLNSLDQLVQTLKNEHFLHPENKENPMIFFQRSFKAVQSQLIQSIQSRGIDRDLWEHYILLVKEMY